MRKKAQMELIGLVIIVILITLGMLFMAQFALKSDPHKKIFTRKGLAYSTMSGIMKTTIEESCGTNFRGNFYPQLGKVILEDCAEYHDTAAGGTSLYRCEGKHSCDFLREKISSLLADTLGQWNKNYLFKSTLVMASGSEPIPLIADPPIIGGQGCPPGRERDSSGLFPIHTKAGLVENVLYICD